MACFCRCKDRLSQWRSYGKGFGGYSIGFKRAEIEATDLRFERVSYDETARERRAARLEREAIVDGTDMLNAQTSEAELWPWLNHGRFGEVALRAALQEPRLRRGERVADRPAPHPRSPRARRFDPLTLWD